MKKNVIVLIVFTMLLCGCGSLLNEDNNEEKTLLREFKCSVLDDVKYKSESYFITNDNEVYVYNINKLYSNNENCKSISNGVKISRLVCGIECYVVDDIGNYYVIDKDNYDLTLKDKDGYFEPGTLGLLQNSEIVFKRGDLILSTDGKLYKENGTTLELYKEISGEKILEYGEHGDMQIMHEGESKPVLGYYIKTDKAFYTTIVTNAERCLTYVDVECEMDFAKNEVLTKKYNDIKLYQLYYNYVDKDGNYYKLSHDEKMYE